MINESILVKELKRQLREQDVEIYRLKDTIREFEKIIKNKEK